MISDELKEHWVRAACLVDLSQNGDAPKFVRDQSIVVEQIDQLFQLDAFKTTTVNDQRFWNDASLKDKILREIQAKQKKAKTPPVHEALQAMQESYNLAYSHKTFGG